MPNLTIRTLFIVGAGFSHYAGLPLTPKFTQALLQARAFKKGPSRPLVHYLDKFVHDAFGHSNKAKGDYWPSLEDLFTCIDLAANTGHHLGPHFPPADLRTVRRALVARTIRMLHREQEQARRTKSKDWRQLRSFFDSLDPTSVGFVVMNWDTVVEQGLAISNPGILFDYCCDGLPAEFPGTHDPEYPSKERSIRVAALPVERRISDAAIPIIKMHGSTNWLYCDNCRELFWFHPSETWRIADQLVRPTEWERIREAIKKRLPNENWSARSQIKQWRCICSNRVVLGTRIATFSYRKALDFPMFQKSWLAAEALLRNASRWVFIGYSLPAADYEFKFLLKRVQLSRPADLRIYVVTGGDKTQVSSTYRNYQRFFGRAIKRTGASRTFSGSGLTDEVISRVSSQ